MREIKFRQFDGKVFHYWGVGVDECTFVGPFCNGKLNAQNTPQDQFTGLKDKNGVEIYEGDIVSVTRHDGVFCGPDFTEIEAVGTPKYEQLEDQFSGGGDGVFSVVSMEILGNIHQNPELLEDSCKTATDV